MANRRKGLRSRKGKRMSLADVLESGSRTRRKASRDVYTIPRLKIVPAERPAGPDKLGREVTVATYNVHRWTGTNGRSAPDPARAGFVISELDADIIALQEVLRPHDEEDPLEAICAALGLHFAFAITREHKRGQQGNAILSRYPIVSCSVLDISHSRLEKRGVLAAQFADVNRSLSVVATHLSLVDRTRSRQVTTLLRHPQMTSGPAVLMGDMNAWRQCKATRRLDDELERHHNLHWPPSFPARRPVLALDRIYSRDLDIIDVFNHDTPASRRASDHIPVLARVRLG